MKPTDEMYAKFEKEIQKLVWKYVNKSRFNFDELLSEANMAFLHAVDTFDRDKSCFHTHLHITVNGRLRNYIKKPGDNNQELDEKLSSNLANPEQEFTFNSMLESFSKEALEVVQTVLNTPIEMVELVKNMTSNRQGKMHLYRSTVTRFFRDKGWSGKQINSAYSEIRSTFNWE